MLRAATKQNEDRLAIFRKVNPVSWSEIKPKLQHSKPDPFGRG